MEHSNLTLFDDVIEKSLAEMLEALKVLSPQDRIAALNKVRMALHEVSPFRDEPVDLILWEPAERIEANDYNPNKVAPPEMRLLRLSIERDGFTQPIVVFPNGSGSEVVDGFHRSRVGREKAIREKLMGYLPVVKIRASGEGKKDRMASTIRHNRARGKHVVGEMSDLVRELYKDGWSAETIAEQLGMDADEVLRMRQIQGLAELFAEEEFSEAWEPA